MKIRIVILCALGVALTGAAFVIRESLESDPRIEEMKQLTKYVREEMRGKLPGIVSKPISKDDAERIAEIYFRANEGCGGVHQIDDKGEFWEVNVAIGYAGTRIVGFRIFKKNGRIVSQMGPSFESLADALK